MKNEIIKSARAFCLVPLTLLCFVTAVAQAQSSTQPLASTKMPQGHMQQGSSGSQEMKQAMMAGMDGMEKMTITGDIDRDFAMMMKMHHQQAVEMANMELAHGKSSAMKAMARQIIVAQKKEIAQFDRWLAKQN